MHEETQTWANRARALEVENRDLMHEVQRLQDIITEMTDKIVAAQNALHGTVTADG